MGVLTKGVEALTKVGDGQVEAFETELKKRRGRYTPAKSSTKSHNLTARQWVLLRWIAVYRILSVPQIALLAGRAQHTIRQQVRGLFDAGLVELIPTNRSTLASVAEPDDASLLFGSAPNIYVPTRRGLLLLLERGLVAREEVERPGYSFGPRSSVALPHTLFIRDVRIWLARTQLHYGEPHQLLRWHDGGDAKLDLKRSEAPLQVVPDAWFIYQLREEPSPRVLVGMVECDRGTERGLVRWNEKLMGYRLLMGGPRLKEITHYDSARVLVLTLDSARRDQLARVIEEFDQARNLEGWLARRFWLADQMALATEGFTSPCWRTPGTSSLQCLISPELL